MKVMRLALMGLLVSGFAYAEDKGASEPKTDEEFVKHAILCDTVEIKMAETAQKKASSPAVQRFAQKMIADHTSNRNALLAIAKEMKVEAPEQVPAERKEEIDRLSKSESSGFDREYIKCQVEAHEKALRLYEKFSREAKNEQVRAAATKATPIIRMHHEEAKRLHGEVGRGTDRDSNKNKENSSDRDR